MAWTANRTPVPGATLLRLCGWLVSFGGSSEHTVKEKSVYKDTYNISDFTTYQTVHEAVP